MNISNIPDSVTSSVNGVRVEAAGSQDMLDQNDFLRLMTTQLRVQDPLSPVNNEQMVAQMAQFSSVAGISEMNSSLKAITQQISAQTQLLQDIRAQSSNPAAPAAGAAAQPD